MDCRTRKASEGPYLDEGCVRVEWNSCCGSIVCGADVGHKAVQRWSAR